ncbi:unnamed protein product [Fraxinus pennsylvanica]|uniref:ARM repeat superfamily protein n=1 Tax=Fraxinus pennsylvanica TaxID=56036 RepID=A0AAD1ZF49_9LAMI|nr:unnamed protein product [Fraxinus pennsylvanica]
MPLGGGSVSRLRSSSMRKPPEPLRRAVADCLSAAASSQQATLSTEASRILRDYLVMQSTIDLAYSVILDHTLAERERSPAVVARCVALLKRYLLRYKPSEETLLQLDRFCVSIIAECDVSINRKLAPWSRSLSQQSGMPIPSTNISLLPVSSFASGALVKSLNYVRSLVAQYIPKRSFQSAVFAGAPPASRQSLPALSSILSRSFNSQLCPANSKDAMESKETSITSVSDSPVAEEVDETEDQDFIALDLFRWRWFGDQQLSVLLPKSEHNLNPQDVRTHNFLEVGAAALLVGDMDPKMKGDPWKFFGSPDMPYLDQLLQPSLLTTVTNSASAHAHLRAITALKRSKTGPNEIWEDPPLSNFRPRVKPLFQYRHYSEQQPLRLNPVEICEVIAAVCTETPSSNSNLMTISSKLSNNGRPSLDVAVSVLVKLIIDMYVLDSETAAPLILSILEDMLNSPKVMSRAQAFDLILNLGVHAHLLEPPAPDDTSAIEEEYLHEAYFENETRISSQGKRKSDNFKKIGNFSAIDKFENWILGILYEVLLHLVQIEEREESVWASGLSCLLYFVCDRGKIRRSRLQGLDIRVSISTPCFAIILCTETPSTNSNLTTISSKLSNNGRPSLDVAVSVLVKLIIDMYVLDSVTAAPLTLSILEDMLNSPKVMSRAQAFDLILNLGVHAHLLEPPAPDDTSAIEEEYLHEPYFENETQLSSKGKRKSDNFKKMGNSSATDKFENWILGILYEVLLHLVQIEEKEESVWASGLSCLLYFVCDRGNIRRSRLQGLDIRVIKVLVRISRRNSWAEIVQSKLICMMTNMFYQVPEGPDKVVSATPFFLVQQLDLIGGNEFILAELVLSNSREERRNLYLVLFDYVLHKINETCIASGVSEYSDDEVQPIATLLMLADAPEALHISVKLGVEGVVELLRRSISTALSRYPNNDRLIMLLESIVVKFDMLIRSFTHLDREFTQMVQITKSYKSLESIDEVLKNSIGIKAKLSWATLHSLLHSERSACRHNGYLWLGDLLIAEISDEGDESLLSSIKTLERKINLAGVNDYSASLGVPLPVWLMCGLLKSRNNLSRWGFLFVLERLLMRCKFLLDESEVQHIIRSEAAGLMHAKNRLEKANAVIDIMSSALSLMAQINETDRMNILKMCDILFSQLCLKVVPTTAMLFGDTEIKDSYSSKWNKADGVESLSQKKNLGREEPTGNSDSKLGKNVNPQICGTASVAALLLHGQAIVPMQLVARIPAALFYWPLIQLAGAATDNIALGVSVGSKGRGNIPGATSDIRATLLLLLIGKCTADPATFTEVGAEEFFRELLDDTDARVAYYSSTFLLKRMMTEEPENYQWMLHSLVSRAQQSNNEKLLENPYLQIRGLLQLSNE